MLDYGEADAVESGDDEIAAAIERLIPTKPVNGCDFPLDIYGQEADAIREGSQLL